MSDPVEAARRALERRLLRDIPSYIVEAAIAAYHAAGGTVAISVERLAMLERKATALQRADALGRHIQAVAEADDDD